MLKLIFFFVFCQFSFNWYRKKEDVKRIITPVNRVYFIPIISDLLRILGKKPLRSEPIKSPIISAEKEKLNKCVRSKLELLSPYTQYEGFFSSNIIRNDT